jgi:hypothetical protein
LLFLSGPACEMTNASSYPLSPNPHHSDTKSANKILVHIFRINQESGRRRHYAARHHHQERRSDVVAPAGDQNIFHLLPFSEYISRRARVCCGEAITRERFTRHHQPIWVPGVSKMRVGERERVRARGHHRIIRGGCAGQQ